MTTAKIQVFSSVSTVDPALGGGWNATFLPSCKGNCLASASLLALGSREKGILPAVGPTELRAGSVIDTPRLTVAGGVAGAEAVTAGDWPLGRLLRFSTHDQ